MLWLFFLLLTNCLADEYSSAKQEQYEKIPGLNLEEIEREFREQDRDIHRPCPVYDLLCIRRYLAQHSKCKPTQGPVPDPLYRTQATLYIPNFNISIVQNSKEISGLTGTVREFYVNRKAKLTVLAVDFRNVSITSRKATFKYHRRGQEPIITTTTTDIEFFPSFTTTTVFKGVDHLTLKNSETVGFIDVLPIVDPGVTGGISSEDPTIPARYINFFSNIDIVVQEAFLTVTPFYASMYIQYVLCDFELFLN